eukprot:XP_011666185.1 PREDICTED: protein slit-like [Strongylocentrotus purpuratus]
MALAIGRPAVPVYEAIEFQEQESQGGDMVFGQITGAAPAAVVWDVVFMPTDRSARSSGDEPSIAEVIAGDICPEECYCTSSYINCYNRLLTTVPTTNVSYNAREFVLSVNRLTIIEDEDFSSLTSLRKLRLSHNAIYSMKSLAFRGLNRLRVLSLKNNRLVDISAIHKLRHADLSENHIRILPDLGNLTSLEKLILTGNPIHLIFSSSPPSKLNLENNQIQHISQSAFINQGHFILRLGNNHLVSILPSSLPLLSRTVYLDPNPWHCDCESTALRRWLLLSGVQLYQCMKPSNFRNRSLISLRESELCPVKGLHYLRKDVENSQPPTSGNSLVVEDGNAVLYYLKETPSYFHDICIKIHNGVLSKCDVIFSTDMNKPDSGKSTLLGLHALSGFDSTSAFKGTGKVKPIKLLQQRNTFVKPLAGLGDSWTVLEELLSNLD